MSLLRSLTNKYFGGGSQSEKPSTTKDTLSVTSVQGNTNVIASTKPPFLPPNKLRELCTKAFNQFYLPPSDISALEYLKRTEQDYINRLDQFLKNVNHIPKPIRENEVIIKANGFLKDILNIHKQFYQALEDPNASDLNTLATLMNQLMNTLDVPYSEYASLQLKLICCIDQFKEIFSPDFLVLCDQWLGDWYLLPLIRIFVYSATNQIIFRHNSLDNDNLLDLRNADFKLSSIFDIIDNLDLKLEQYTQLKYLEYYLDQSNVKEFGSKHKAENPAMICSPDTVETRSILLREQFYDLDYSSSISTRSSKRLLEIVLLSDTLLICQPVTMFTKKGRKEQWLSLVYPPFDLDDLKLIDYPDTRKGIKNLLELRVAQKDILILQAATSMSKCVWLQEFENLGLTQNPDNYSKLGSFPTVRTSFSTFMLSNSTTPKTLKRISRGLSDISIPLSVSKALPPPINMEGTESIFKIRRCHLWMWRHNIEDNLRWMREGLVTVEIRFTFNKRPFLIMYSEKSNLWDETLGAIIFSSWIVPSTDVDRSGNSRVFLLKKYCLEPITADDTNRLVAALNHVKQTAPEATEVLTVTSHLFSIAKVRVFYFTDGHWEPIGHCMVEIRRTTADRNSFALLLDMTRREIFNDWILETTQVVRMNATNVRLAFTGAHGLSQFLVRARESEIDKLVAEMQREVTVGNQPSNGADRIAHFVSCYGPGREYETPQFENVCKMYTISQDDASWLSIGLGIVQINSIAKPAGSTPQFRMFCVATTTYELVFNELLSVPLGVHRDANQAVIVFEKDGIQKQVGVQFKTAAIAEHFVDALTAYQTLSMEMDVDDPPTNETHQYRMDPIPHIETPAIEHFAELQDDSVRIRSTTPISQMMDASEYDPSDIDIPDDSPDSESQLESTTVDAIDMVPEDSTHAFGPDRLDDTPEMREYLTSSWKKASNSFSKASGGLKPSRSIRHVSEIFAQPEQ